jgi:hypothetical protein
MQSYFAREGRQYRCRRRYAAGVCPAPAYVAAETIEPYVVQQFIEIVGDVRAVDPTTVSAELAAAETAVADAEAALIAFRDDPVVSNALTPRDFAAGVNARRDAFEDARAALLEAAGGLAPSTSDLPENLVEAWPELDTDEKREVLSAGVDAVFMRRGRSRHEPVGPYAHICFAGEAPRDLPRRGVKVISDISGFTFPSAA